MAIALLQIAISKESEATKYRSVKYRIRVMIH
jgi:hypothetical protein